ncbi:MAG TPA: hypothetical protein VED17_09090 [Nitrososphaerales archaeon]|nr:hypothetical protein [Nitrososphaerales archaeon]
MEDRQYSEKGFNATIFQCIDRALNTLGENAKLALYYQIGSKLNLDAKQFPTRPLDVAESLHKILGDSGYVFIERLMIREIKVTFDLHLKEGMSFSQVVSHAREKFLS